MNAAIDMETLWHNHHAKLLRYVGKRVPRDRVEDVVQTVYLRACEAARRGNTVQHANGWLYRIAHNLVIDLYRMRDKTPHLVELDAPADMGDDGRPRSNGEVMVDDSLTPDELAERAMTVQAVQEAINRLPESHAFVVRCRMAGYEWREVAAAMKRDCEAAKSVQVRAYGNLRRMLTPGGDVVPGNDATAHSARLIREAIQEHGPMTASWIMHYTGLPRSTVYATLYNTGMFRHMSETRQAEGFRWGLTDEGRAGG